MQYTEGNFFFLETQNNIERKKKILERIIPKSFAKFMINKTLSFLKNEIKPEVRS